MQAMRLVLSGVFDEFPKLKIILGHLGETLPFLLWRANDTLARRAQAAPQLPRIFRRALLHHDLGQLLAPALQCTIAEMGVERVLFSVDWPFQPNGDGGRVRQRGGAVRGEREQIFGANARRLLRV